MSSHSCECGCGLFTNVCERNDSRRSWVKGQPKRFINGHILRQFDKPIKYEVDPQTDCWNCILYVREDGYGQIKHNNITQLAHRWNYQRLKEVALADDKFLDHLCRNRRCVNPEHLEAVTFVENIRRGNVPTLTIELARTIRDEYIPFVVSQHHLARKYGVDRSLVAAVVQNRTWLEST